VRRKPAYTASWLRFTAYANREEEADAAEACRETAARGQIFFVCTRYFSFWCKTNAADINK